jgi:hypothetical protein
VHVRLWNVDPMPVHIPSTFLGTIKNTTPVVLSGTGPSSAGETLALAAITPGTTAAAFPGTECGTIGGYTISNSQTLSVATWRCRIRRLFVHIFRHRHDYDRRRDLRTRNLQGRLPPTT